MSFIDKLKFWKKKEPSLKMPQHLESHQGPALPDDAMGHGRNPIGFEAPGTDRTGLPPSAGPFGEKTAPQDPTQPESFNRLAKDQDGAKEEFFQPFKLTPEPMKRQRMPQQFQQQQMVPSKDHEIISAKLDTLRAMLETLNHRLAKMEHILEEKDSSSSDYIAKRVKRGW